VVIRFSATQVYFCERDTHKSLYNGLP
jgi:hypothetical protein